MGIVRTERKRLREAERENMLLRQQLEDARATIEYISMMTDVDIDGPEEDPEIGG